MKSPAKPSAIARLLALLNKPPHPYRPATEVFLDLDVDSVAAELVLTERGSERGANNRPAQDAQTLDDIEYQIIERVESHKQAAHSLYLEHGLHRARISDSLWCAGPSAPTMSRAAIRRSPAIC
jgi:hypothetical protein